MSFEQRVGNGELTRVVGVAYDVVSNKIARGEAFDLELTDT